MRAVQNINTLNEMVLFKDVYPKMFRCMKNVVVGCLKIICPDFAILYHAIFFYILWEQIRSPSFS